MTNSAILKALLLVAASVASLPGATTLAAPTQYFKAFTFLPPSQGGNSGQTFDPLNDQQTGDAAADFVGNATTPGLYMGFDSLGDSDLANGTIYFRARMGEMYHTGNAYGDFSSAMIVGIDFNQDSRIDMFVGFDGRGGTSSKGVRYWASNCGPIASDPTCNTGPSTTGLGSELTQYFTAPSSSNYHYVHVNATTAWGAIDSFNTNFNLDFASEPNNKKETDAFMTFAANFANISGYAATQGFTVSQNTSLRFIVVTSQQTNSFNQDLGGCAVVNSATPWSQCGLSADTPLTSIEGVPEPSTIILSGAGLAVLWLTRRRRRSA